MKFFLTILLFFIHGFSYAEKIPECDGINLKNNSAFLELHRPEQNIFTLNIMRPQFSIQNLCIFIKSLPANEYESLPERIKLIQLKKSYEETAVKNKVVSFDLSKSLSLKGDRAILFFGDQIKHFFKLFGMEQYYFDSDLYRRMEELGKENNKKILLEISFRI